MQKKPKTKTLKLKGIKSVKKLKYNSDGLIPVVVQDVKNKEILMLAYMNEKSLRQTLKTGLATYWSRSRQCFWVKGETSGHYQIVKKILFDCDMDALVIMIDQIGVACHTGERTCFYRRLA